VRRRYYRGGSLRLVSVSESSPLSSRRSLAKMAGKERKAENSIWAGKAGGRENRLAGIRKGGPDWKGVAKKKRRTSPGKRRIRVKRGGREKPQVGKTKRCACTEGRKKL